jgi:hypothetical protein
MILFLLMASGPAAAALVCDLSKYTPQAEMKAELKGDALQVTWQGERGQSLRAAFGIDQGQPVIRELDVLKAGQWIVLGAGLRPEFHVTSGLRRISNQQLGPLKALGPLTQELIEREKWKVFWDAPLNVPGPGNRNPETPRRPEEVRRAMATYNAGGCEVRTDGARTEVTFPGLSMGIFSGRLVFTMYRGSNLLRQEAIVKTEEPSVAYKYEAGLTGFRIGLAKRVIWRDVARAWQKYEFGGAPNNDRVALRARNRLAIVETGEGSLAFFPPPHKFFFAREIELNLGYVWFRKDNNETFSVGVRQADREEMYRPYGASDEVWQRRVAQSRGFAEGNFALYNAPPGTWQRMAAYYLLSAENGERTQQAVMAYTHDDRFKAVPGYQVAVSHFHTHFNELLADAGSLDVQPGWLPVFKALGINIAMMSDFHGDGHPKDQGPLRYKEQKVYFEGCRRHSDTDFLIMPGEEPDAHFGGHYTMVFPKPVYWSHVRKDGQQFVEQHPEYGKAYHVGSAKEELDLLKAEGGLVWQAHPRTKGSSGHPEAIRHTEYFLSDRYLGGAFQSLPVDLSEKRLCESRCFGTLDDMNNWGAPKYLIAEGDTYQKYPDDDTYSHLIVNYVKLDRLPRYDEDWSPILKAMRAGDFFVTSGEVLLRGAKIEGSGASRTMVVEAEWTFPPEFAELVWGDGAKTDRTIVTATELTAFDKKIFRIPFDVTGKKWVRFALWDSAGNGAFTQPVHLR